MGKQTTRLLRKLAEIQAEIYYSPFSILESLWVASRNVKNSTFDIERFSHGLRSVVESGRYMRLNESGEVYRGALGLYTLGHVDMIDNILYVSSVHFGIRFLTLDRKLTDFIKEKGLENTFLPIDYFSKASQPARSSIVEPTKTKKPGSVQTTT
jgi:hypothetical protein